MGKKLTDISNEAISEYKKEEDDPLYMSPEEIEEDEKAGRAILEDERRELEELKKEHPDAIYSNSEYENIREHEIAKAGLYEVPIDCTDDEWIDYMHKCAAVIEPIYKRRWEGWSIDPSEPLPPQDLSFSY